jgi:hypothetical protein
MGISGRSSISSMSGISSISGISGISGRDDDPGGQYEIHAHRRIDLNIPTVMEHTPSQNDVGRP